MYQKCEFKPPFLKEMRMFNIKRKKEKIKNYKNGFSLYLAILVLSVLISIAVGLNTIVINQLKMVREFGNSVIALHAADTGVETALFCLYQPEKCPSSLCSFLSPPNFDCTGNLGEATFEVKVRQSGTIECPSSVFNFYCIISTGRYKETSRTISAGY